MNTCIYGHKDVVKMNDLENAPTLPISDSMIPLH